MNRIANDQAPPEAGRRGYHSPIRAEQTDATRARILDATVRVMAGGLATLSIPAVAKEAGVSVPTVYRHFGSKPELLAALYPHLAGRTGFSQMTAPRSVDEFGAVIRDIFDRLDSFDELARAAVASPAADEARRATMPGRIALSRRFAEAVAPHAGPADRDRLARLLVVLTTSSALRVWRDHLDASVDEAVADIEWILRAAIASAADSGDEP